jgi:hypothetical protein
MNHVLDNFCMDLPVNGELYATLEGGHDTNAIPENRAYFPQAWPLTGQVLERVVLPGTPDEGVALCREFILLNTHHMMNLVPVWRPNDTQEERLSNAYKVALLRLSAALQGLAAPHFNVALNHAQSTHHNTTVLIRQLCNLNM